MSLGELLELSCRNDELEAENAKLRAALEHIALERQEMDGFVALGFQSLAKRTLAARDDSQHSDAAPNTSSQHSEKKP